MHDSNTDFEPDYVRDRIEHMHDMGRKYLVGLILCGALLATTAIERQGTAKSDIPPAFADNIVMREIGFIPDQTCSSAGTVLKQEREI
jgi:hypothetical protein